MLQDDDADSDKKKDKGMYICTCRGVLHGESNELVSGRTNYHSKTQIWFKYFLIAFNMSQMDRCNG